MCDADQVIINGLINEEQICCRIITSQWKKPKWDMSKIISVKLSFSQYIIQLRSEENERIWENVNYVFSAWCISFENNGIVWDLYW